MRRNKKILSLIIVFTLITVGFGIFYNESPKKAVDSGNSDTNSYVVDWKVKESSLISCSEYISKNSDYEKTISFETPNLKEITFSLSWTDDKAPFLGRFGLDTLILEVTTPDGRKLTESVKSAKKTKQGNIEITLPINNIKPTALTLESEDILEAGKQLNTDYFDYIWVDEEFTVKVSVQPGEIRPLKRFADRGNDFDLEIIYSYYHASLTEGEKTTDTDSIGDNSFKETEYVPPPSMCPFCDGNAWHEPWCPYREDPWDDDWWEDDDDPWEDDWWEDDDDYRYTIESPWEAVVLFIFFLFTVFFQSMLIF